MPRRKRQQAPPPAEPVDQLAAIRNAHRMVAEQRNIVRRLLADARIAREELRRRERVVEQLISEELPLFEP